MINNFDVYYFGLISSDEASAGAYRPDDYNWIDFARRSVSSLSIRMYGTSMHFRGMNRSRFVKMLNAVIDRILVISPIWRTEAFESFSRESRINSQNYSLGPSWSRRGITGPARAPRDSCHRRIRHCNGTKDLNKSCVERNGRHPLLVELEDKIFLCHVSQ
jgi:hypothetical protein